MMMMCSFSLQISVCMFTTGHAFLGRHFYTAAEEFLWAADVEAIKGANENDR